MIAVISWRKLSVGGEGAWSHATLEDEGTHYIGRSRGNLICVDDLRVSRRHLSLQKRGDQVLAQDYGSANGAFLDGEAFKSAIWMQGQRLQIADYEFRLSWKDAAVSQRPAAPEAAPPQLQPEAEVSLAGRGAVRQRPVHPQEAAGADGRGDAYMDPQAVALAVAAAQADAVQGRGRAGRQGGQRIAAPTTATRPSRRIIQPSPMLSPFSTATQLLSLAAIVLTSMLMTANVIILSAASKTSQVERKASDILSGLGLDISIGGADGGSLSDAIDGWAFAWDIEAYRWLSIAAWVVCGLAVLALIGWQAAAARSLHLGTHGSLVFRILDGPAAWFIPFVNLVQPPRAIKNIYDTSLKLDARRSDMGGGGTKVWLWWACLLGGLALIAAAAVSAPERLDAYGFATTILGPVLMICAAAFAAVIVRDVTHRIFWSAKGGS